MPEDYIDESGKLSSKRKSDALYKRYEDNKAQRDREQFITDLDRYEEEQTKNSTLQAGALDRQNLALPADEYEYVFDEAAKIEWVLESKDALEGTMTKGEMELQMKINAAEQKGACAYLLFKPRFGLLKSFSRGSSQVYRRSPEIASGLRVAGRPLEGGGRVSSAHHRG
jgi:hypothetical protein